MDQPRELEVGADPLVVASVAQQNICFLLFSIADVSTKSIGAAHLIVKSQAFAADTMRDNNTLVYDAMQAHAGKQVYDR